MISSLNRRIVVGSSRADAELSTSTTTSPSMIHAVATSGRSVYRTLGNGLCYLHTEPKTNARGYSGEAVCVEPDDFCSYGERKDDKHEH